MRFLPLIMLCVFVLSACKKEEKTLHDNGQVHEIFETNSNEEKDGAYTRYDLDGNLFEETTYQNGALHGERTIYYPSGEVEIKEVYVDDKLNGKYIRYYKNGQVAFEATFKDNLMQGKAVNYYEDGTTKDEAIMVDNMENGPFVEYYENGQVHWKGTYKNGDNEFGLLEEYTEDGQLKKKMMCDDNAICRTIWTPERGDIEINESL